MNGSGIVCVCVCLEVKPTPDVYQGEVMDLLKEFTKNREMEQRLDAPNLEYLDKSSKWGLGAVDQDEAEGGRDFKYVRLSCCVTRSNRREGHWWMSCLVGLLMGGVRDVLIVFKPVQWFVLLKMMRMRIGASLLKLSNSHMPESPDQEWPPL